MREKYISHWRNRRAHYGLEVREINGVYFLGNDRKIPRDQISLKINVIDLKELKTRVKEEAA